MKSQILSIVACFTLLMGISINTQAQGLFNDTIFVFNKDAMFDINDNIKGFNIGMPPTLTFDVTPAAKSVFVKVTAIQAKKVSVPRATRISSKPITLEHKGACYKFGCDCKTCKIGWYDRNGDNKVQPRKELRCLCTKDEQCKIRVEKTDCK